MTTDDPILRELSDANPATGRTDADASQAERVRRYALSDGPARPQVPRGSRPVRRPSLTIVLGALSVLVVAAVVVAALGAGHRGASSVTPGAGNSVTLVYRMLPTPPAPKLTGAAIDRELALLRHRLRGQTVRSRVTRVGADEVAVAVSSPHLSDAVVARIELLVGSSDSVQFYDWEANVLLPSGRTVASEGRLPSSSAVTLSQGTEEDPPGTAGAGGVTLYEAVKLASTQAAAPSSASLSRLGPEYFSFGAPGSQACAAAAADRGAVPLAGEYCYLAGPASSASALPAQVPRGVSATDAKVLTVPQGVGVVQASNQRTIQPGAQTARFFVLRDRVGLSSTQIIDPRVASEGGELGIDFAFTPLGRKQFQSLTATIAHRGEAVSSGSTHLFEHFGVELNGRLLAVPQINFDQYPDGVIETHLNDGAIPADSVQQARQVVSTLRLGPLPLALQLVSAQR